MWLAACKKSRNRTLSSVTEMGILKKLFQTIFILEVSSHLLTSECKAIDGHIRKYIRKYEKLDYNSKLVNENHERNRRCADYILTIKIRAFGRDLTLELTKDRKAFTDDYVIVLNNGSVLEDDVSFLYSGVVKDIPGSYCYGSVIQGIYQGSIQLPDDTVYVEKSNSFLRDGPVFHSIIYKESDINLDHWRTHSGCKEQENDHIFPRKQSYQRNPPKRYRNKRATNMPGTKNTCTLYLVSDWLLWDRFLEKSGGDAEVTRQEIVAMLYAHVHTVNRIFLRTTFQTYDGSLKYQGVQLAIKKIKINVTKSDCDFPPCAPYIDSASMIQQFATTNFDEFCLAYAFTYRDFTDGVLGLAFTAYPNRASGGICEKYKEYSENTNKVWKSLNTGIITLYNYGTEIPLKLSQLGFAHTIGHSFGSPDDTGDVCVPDDSRKNGNYIMFSGVISGDRPNDYQFSPCSKDSIARVLNSPQKDCLIENKPICGNHVIEDGEECDCGYPDDCEEVCCNPVICKLNKEDGNVCSPSQGQCCSNSCQYMPAGHVCKAATDCTLTSICSGLTADCTKVNKEDGLYCATFTATCKNGECDGSLCERIGWSQCFITGAMGSLAEQCLLACEKNGTCVASHGTEVDRYPEYKQMRKETTGQFSDRGIGLQTGTPCNNYLGYCDRFTRCRSKDSDNVFADTDVIDHTKTIR